ncbi:MAG: pyruvate, phosphate dikinase, partial [Deltaproteobacteria bacterium]|nr:pyruvate, phosphate dikinase [Deltaproteobacteria bacterium]
MLKFLNMFWEKKKDRRSIQEEDLFKKKYGFFKSLLLKNTEALNLLTDLEQQLFENRSFTLDSFINKTEKLISKVYELAEDLNGLTGGRYPEAFDQVEKLGVKILRGLVKKKKVRKSHLILPLRSLSLDNLAEVGGKSANLGEVANRVNLPVPPGFAVSAYACHYFLGYNKLLDELAATMSNLDIHDTERLVEVCEGIQARIMVAEIPPDMLKAMYYALSALKAEFGPGLRMSVRSSATCEDSVASFAGQHSTILNVSEENLAEAYKEVVASAYGPRAVFYARSKGYSHKDVIMAVLCVAMVESKASGVAYTVDPNNPALKDIIISAAWGLGVSVVDGSSQTDEYRVDKKTGAILSSAIAKKEELLASADTHGLDTRPVPGDLQDVACLSEERIRQLADFAIKLENHYGVPLDIEWAMNGQDRLFILPARPLNPQLQTEERPQEPILDQDHPILVRGGATASKGTAAGKAYLLLSEHNLLNVPDGAILVARKTSPYYVPIIVRIAAIVTDIGSVTGHMASVAREFGVPTLVGLHRATQRIEHGQEITVDATNRIVYSGVVSQILKEKPVINLMKGSPTLLAAQEALKIISPLHLVDPKSENFNPKGCETIHDVIRFVHEQSMREMFNISDDMDESDHQAVLLKVKLPMRIFMVDLGGGLKVDHDTKSVGLEQVASTPFLALLKGMTHEKVQWLG